MRPKLWGFSVWGDTGAEKDGDSSPDGERESKSAEGDGIGDEE